MPKKYKVNTERGYIEYKTQAEALEAHPNETAVELDYTPEAENKILDGLKAELKSAEKDLPITLEHIIDSMSETQKSRIPAETLDKYDAKKLIRSQITAGE